ncbi:MAG: hypothetical protein SGI92_08460 [Bryobacteraceae bacterium]|nr:hypothetical protein [Bryobacteraceae bacterium]
MARKKQTFDQSAEVRKLARERVGIVKASRPIEPKDTRKKPKYKKPPEAADEGGTAG